MTSPFPYPPTSVHRFGPRFYINRVYIFNSEKREGKTERVNVSSKEKEKIGRGWSLKKSGMFLPSPGSGQPSHVHLDVVRKTPSLIPLDQYSFVPFISLSLMIPVAADICLVKGTLDFQILLGSTL